MLSIRAVLRTAHPLNRKLDLEFKALCPPADLTFSIDSSEQEVKIRQNMRTFNYNVLDETPVRRGVKTSPTDSGHTCSPTSANWGKKKEKKGGGKKNQTKKQTNKQINLGVEGDGERSKRETSEN